MENQNNFGRLLLLLLLTLAMCLGLYRLPDHILGYAVKRVDLLADIRVSPSSSTLDSLKQALWQPDTLLTAGGLTADSLTADSFPPVGMPSRRAGVDSARLALGDSLARAIYGEAGADSLGTHIEDYSVGHVGLQRFFARLNRRDELQRPVRIAFLGDSFIEGDILVADLRSALQKRFGGRGVGFVPVASVAGQFRPTVKVQSEGWITRSILTDRSRAFVLSGMLFDAASSTASLGVKTTGRYPEIQAVSSLRFYYRSAREVQMQLVCNAAEDTLKEVLPSSETLAEYVRRGELTQARFRFTDAEGLQALGVALEDESGIVVDNFSLRGNSGLVLERLDSARCRDWQAMRPYDLIVLQYGLNVVSDGVLHYGWYAKGMLRVVNHLRVCYPDADILLLGVSDRSRQRDGAFETMPAVWALLHAQREVARASGLPFWNVFGAMGGENSMVRFVEKNWASKDYTHLGFPGGREIAKALMEALMTEKKLYDEADKMAD